MTPIMTRTPFALALGSALLLACAASAHAVTCVNGLAATNPDNSYTVHGDGTVTDTATGLMWKQCLEGQSGPACATGTPTGYNWGDALALAEASTFAGYGDWRLPNQKELRTLVEECRASPAINDAVFPNTPANSYAWSGSPRYAGGGVHSLVVNFDTGNSSFAQRNLAAVVHVRLVRAGQAVASVPGLSGVALAGPPAEQSATVQGTSTLAGDGYWLVVPQGSPAPTPAQVRAQAAYGGVTPVATGTGAMPTANAPANFPIAGLVKGTTYDFYLVADASGSLSAVAPLAFATAGAPVAGGPAAIPTLSQWALTLLAGALGLLSVGALRRRG